MLRIEFTVTCTMQGSFVLRFKRLPAQRIDSLGSPQSVTHRWARPPPIPNRSDQDLTTVDRRAPRRQRGYLAIACATTHAVIVAVDSVSPRVWLLRKRAAVASAL